MSASDRLSRKRDAKLIAALASGSTVIAAAKACGISDRTVRRRMEDSRFEAAVDTARAAMLGRLLGKLTATGTKAGSVLKALLRSESEVIRLRAADAVLKHLMSVHYDLDLSKRLEILEEAERRRTA